MAITIPRFNQIAFEIASRASELLAADVTVVDEHGDVVSKSAPDSIDHGNGHHSHDCVRVPLRYGSYSGEAIVARPAGQRIRTGEITQVLLEMLIQQIAAVNEASNVPQVKDRFIHKLICGSVEDEHALVREAQILGMDLTQPRAVILIDVADFVRGGGDTVSIPEEQARKRAERVIDSIVGFFTLPDDNICGYIGDGELVVLKASSTRDLTPWSPDGGEEEDPADSWANLGALKRACDALLKRLQRDTDETVTVGVGRYHPGISGIARSYQDARAALSLGRHFHGENQVHCLNNLGLASFVGVSDDVTKCELANYLLGPLDGEANLIETTEVFFSEGCCPTATAHRLGIHRNTVSYRLHKVNSLIGLNPTSFEDAVQIRLALALRSLHASRS